MLWRDSNLEFRGLLLRSSSAAAGIGLVMLAAAALIGERFLTLIYSEDYRAYGHELIVVAAAGLCWYVAGILGCAVNATRRFGLQLGLYVTALGVLILVSLALIPDRGVAGAAYALLAAMATRLVLGMMAIIWLLSRRETEDGKIRSNT